MREFDTGATRNDDTTQLDYEGFLSPLVLKRFGEYMHKHRKQADGKLRDSDNWQKGIPTASYMKSLLRHTFDTWLEHRGYESRDGLEEALCAVLFNAQGYLLEVLKQKQQQEVNDIHNYKVSKDQTSPYHPWAGTECKKCNSIYWGYHNCPVPPNGYPD